MEFSQFTICMNRILNAYQDNAQYNVPQQQGLILKLIFLINIIRCSPAGLRLISRQHGGRCPLFFSLLLQPKGVNSIWLGILLIRYMLACPHSLVMLFSGFIAGFDWALGVRSFIQIVMQITDRCGPGKIKSRI